MAGVGEQTINPIPQAQSNFLEVLQTFLQNEDADRLAFTWRGWVVQGGLHPTGPGLTATPDPLIAFAGGFYITEFHAIHYEDNVTSWVIAHKDTGTFDIGPYLRVANTHYLFAVAVTAPPLPTDCIRLMKVVTSAGAIVDVQDERVLFPEFQPGLEPHIRLEGTESGAVDLRVGEVGGAFEIDQNVGTSDLPAWTNRMRWDMPTIGVFYHFLVTAQREYSWPDKSGVIALVSDIAGGVFGPGTRMVFDQDAAPTGWVRDTTLDDRVLRVVGGTRADGGSWTVTGISVGPHVHDLGAHKHELPLWDLSTVLAAAWPHGTSGNTYPSDRPAPTTVATEPTFLSAPAAGNTGAASPPVISDGSWRPLHRDVIVCVKS